MPIAYTIDPTNGLIHTIATGALSDAEFRAFVLRQVHDPAIQFGMKELADYRQVARVDVTAQALRDTVALLRTHPQWSGNPLAIVVSGSLVYGLSRMYQILAEAHLAPMEIFRRLCVATLETQSRRMAGRQLRAAIQAAAESTPQTQPRSPTQAAAPHGPGH